MRFPHILSLLGLLNASRAASISRTPRTREVFHFSNATFIETIAVRPNGHLLLDTFDNGRMYTIDPSAQHAIPHLVAEFPGVSGLTGIVEVAPDVFAVSGGRLNPATYRMEKGSARIFLISFGCGSSPGKDSPTVAIVADVPDTELLNGMTSLPKYPHVILSADSVEGLIYRIDTSTGVVDIAFRDEKLGFPSNTTLVPLGVNGIKVHDDYLYFSNSAQQLFGRIKITPEGDRAGEVEEIATVPNTTGAYDDFAVAKDGTAYVTLHPFTVVKITPDGKQTAIAEDTDSTVFYDPTSAALSRDGRKLYVVSGGAVLSGGTSGGQVVEVHL